jgi:hypothetical protein
MTDNAPVYPPLVNLSNSTKKTCTVSVQRDCYAEIASSLKSLDSYNFP